MNQKTIIAILGVAVVILIGATVYFMKIDKTSQPAATPVAQQSTQPTISADWKTYTNTDWGFSISYPTKYQLNDNKFKKELPYYKDLVDIVSIPNKQSSPALAINVVNDFAERNPRHITDINDYVAGAYPASNNNQTISITINGNSGYQIDIGGDPNVKPRHIVLQDKDGVIYDLFLPADDSDMNSIAHTFVFTK